MATSDERQRGFGADVAPMELWRFARQRASRWCSQGATADDVAQEVLLAYVRQQTRINVPRAWAIVVARRVAVKMSTKAPPAFVTNTAIDRGYSPPTDLQIDLLRAFRRLDPRSQKLMLWTARGDTHEQIAGRLGCSRSDVGTLVARARKRMAMLSGYGLACQQRPISKHT